MNSNDPIFKTDLASLKYSKPMSFIQKIFNDTQSSSKLLKTKYKKIYDTIKIN